MRKVKLNLLDPDSIQNAIDELERYKDFLKERIPVFINALADRGVSIASVKFGQASYDGTNDVQVNVDRVSKKCTAVVATGNATLFIEFGTGIYNPGHPDPVAAQLPHGGYGYGLGRMEAWRYKGDPGTDGWVDPKHPDMVTTRGNAANACMYYTVRELENMFADTAREVFKYD